MGRLAGERVAACSLSILSNMFKCLGLVDIPISDFIVSGLFLWSLK